MVSPDELDQIMEYVEKHISELYEKIHEGLIPIHPTLMEGAQPRMTLKYIHVITVLINQYVYLMYLRTKIE